jgi:hypothetical protein
VIVLENATVGGPLVLAPAILDTLRGPAVNEPASSPTPGGDVAGDAVEPDRTGVYRADPGESSVDALEIVAGADGPCLRWRGRLVAVQGLGDGRFLVPDPDFDRFALRFDPPDGRPNVAWHGPTRFVRDGAVVPRLPDPDLGIAALAGHYGSHNPWTTNFHVFVRGDVPWLALPGGSDGFDDEQPLVPLPDGSFRVGDDPAGPEDVRFDTVVDGRPLRAWLSGCPYYRIG